MCEWYVVSKVMQSKVMQGHAVLHKVMQRYAKSCKILQGHGTSCKVKQSYVIMQRTTIQTDIIIKPADKGSATVVMSRDDCSKKVMDHLNTLFYEKLQDDPTKRFSEEITTVLAGMTEREILGRDTFDFL